MNIDDLLKGIDPKWHKEFRRFIDCGEASQDFLDFLDSDADMQRIVELVFNQQVQALEEFARELHEIPEQNTVMEYTDAAHIRASNSIARGFEEALSMSDSNRINLLESLSMEISKLAPEDKSKLKEMVSKLNTKLVI